MQYFHISIVRSVDAYMVTNLALPSLHKPDQLEWEPEALFATVDCDFVTLDW